MSVGRIFAWIGVALLWLAVITLYAIRAALHYNHVGGEDVVGFFASVSLWAFGWALYLLGATRPPESRP